jgi:hypothetical protein
LLCVASPAPESAGLGLLALGIFGTSVIIASIVSLIRAYGSQEQARPQV